MYNDYSNSFDFLLRKDNSVKIHHRNIQKVAIEMYKVKHGLCPKMMTDLFVTNTDQVNTRGNPDFVRPRNNTVSYGQQSIRCFGPIVWDSMLPEDIKKSTNLVHFKQQIKAWIPQNCRCRLCIEYIPNLGFVDIHQ